MNITESVFTERIRDPRALYITPEAGRDDTRALQDIIKLAAEKLRCGVIYVAEGEYLLRDTVQIPTGIRLIGYGKKRPLFKLEDNCPAFKEVPEGDKGDAKYLLWFVGRLPAGGRPAMDANAGTFYSALQNIDISLGKGNEKACALRAHYAQHSFISYVSIEIGDSKAGIFDTGNAIDHVGFYGGDYGIYTTKSSPAWQFSMLDCHFEGQRKAALKTREAGITAVNLSVKDCPVAISVDEGFCEKLYVEHSSFENISDCAVLLENEESSYSQYHMEDIVCKNVKCIARSRDGKVKLESYLAEYKVTDFTNGLVMEKTDAKACYKSYFESVEAKFEPYTDSRLRTFPCVSTWKSVHDLGVKGDGTTDDTAAIQKAVDTYDVLFFPQGRYIVTDTIKLRDKSMLIGMHPIMTQIEALDNTPAFSFFGAPKPLVETPLGGDNIISGIGINAGGRNQRAVGIMWRSGATSMINDVKFVGGHGSVGPNGEREGAYNSSKTGDLNDARKWDSMFPSLWIEGGGGSFYDVWSASSYASAGIYISNTDVGGGMYEVSVEHHVRAEVRLRNVKNFKLLALQLEEEQAESSYCQPLEIIDCENVTFANFYAFRVIWLLNPWEYAALAWNSKNVVFYGFHNFTQVKLTMDNSLLDVNNNIEVRPWQLAKLVIDGKGKGMAFAENEIARGFEFIDGMCTDSKGNVYFADGHRKRIYRWNAADDRVEMLLDSPYKPLSLAVDTEDRLLVVVEYMPQRGMMVDGKPERYPAPEDARGVDYGKWYAMLGNDIRVFALDPDNADNTLVPLETVKLADVKPERIWYPANRWRNNNDWLEITVKKNEEAFIAPDGKTVIPDIYDLLRASSLSLAEPGKPFYCLDEYYRRTYRFDVDENGWLSSPVLVAEKGEQGIAFDGERLFIADCDIIELSEEGKILGEYPTVKRAAALAISGDYIYAAARGSLLRIRIK